MFLLISGSKTVHQYEGWRIVKSETRRDAEILVRNPRPRLFGEKFWDSKKVKANHEKTRLRDLSKMLPRFSRSCQNFLRPTFFEVPFATPNMASPFKALQRCMKHQQITQKLWATKTWDLDKLFKNKSFITFHFLGFLYWTFSNLFFCCMTVNLWWAKMVFKMA